VFENIIDTSVFVQLLFISFIVIVSINIIVALISLGLSLYMKTKRLS
jgi:hypothetical protein